jgi:hypothetical protein
MEIAPGNDTVAFTFVRIFQRNVGLYRKLRAGQSFFLIAEVLSG